MEDDHPLMVLHRFVSDDSIEAAEKLAKKLRVNSVDQSPELLRILEDIAAMNRYSELTALGESRSNAIRRTARDIGFKHEKMRYRMRIAQKRTAE